MLTTCIPFSLVRDSAESQSATSLELPLCDGDFLPSHWFNLPHVLGECQYTTVDHELSFDCSASLYPMTPIPDGPPPCLNGSFLFATREGEVQHTGWLHPFVTHRHPTWAPRPYFVLLSQADTFDEAFAWCVFTKAWLRRLSGLNAGSALIFEAFDRFDPYYEDGPYGGPHPFGALTSLVVASVHREYHAGLWGNTRVEHDPSCVLDGAAAYSVDAWTRRLDVDYYRTPVLDRWRVHPCHATELAYAEELHASHHFCGSGVSTTRLTSWEPQGPARILRPMRQGLSFDPGTHDQVVTRYKEVLSGDFWLRI